MKKLLPLLVLPVLITPAWAECNLAAITKALEAPLDALKRTERDVTDVQSTEGGVWQIYRERDGRLNSIKRIDGGESGMQETRLSVVNRDTYGIASTRVDYLRHAFIEEGPFGIAKRTTDYYYYCNGKPYVPGENGAVVDLKAYPKAAAKARKLMLDDKDITEFTEGLTR